MMQRNERRYLQHTVRRHFGPVVCEVASKLLARGPQVLAELGCKLPKVTAARLREALVVLIQHGIVKVTVVRYSPESSAQRVLYEIDATSIHFRARFARYVELARSRFGPAGGSIVEALCLHGTLSREDAISIASGRPVDKPSRRGAGVGAGSSSGVALDAATLGESFDLLVKGRYLRRADTLGRRHRVFCPGRQRKVGLQEVIVPKGIAKRGRKSTEAMKFVENTLEEDRKGYESDTFKLPTGEASSSDQQGAADAAESAPHELFQIHNHKFTAVFRAKAVASYARRRLGDTLGPLGSAVVLAVTERYPVNAWGERQPLQQPAIESLLPASIRRSPEILKKCLSRLAETGILEETSRGSNGLSPFYVVSLEGTCTELKWQHAQSIVGEKYGPSASRVFKLLLKKQQLEEKQVADMATVPKKMIRRLLHQMMIHGFTLVQDVPRDKLRTPSRMMYVWSVPKSNVCRSIVDSLYFAWVNLSLRCAHETQAVAPILEKVKNGTSLDQTEKVAFGCWERANRRLRDAMNKVSNELMLFRDFE